MSNNLINILKFICHRSALLFFLRFLSFFFFIIPISILEYTAIREINVCFDLVLSILFFSMFVFFFAFYYSCFLLIMKHSSRSDNSTYGGKDFACTHVDICKRRNSKRSPVLFVWMCISIKSSNLLETLK